MGDNDKRLTIIFVLHQFCFKMCKLKTNSLSQQTKKKTKTKVSLPKSVESS